MSTARDLDTHTDEVLDAARGGDREAFETLVLPHQRALHLHSYRMLGSFTDAQDAVQETLLHAWQGLSRFEGRAPLSHWLYRISTTTCLKMIERRERQPLTTPFEVAWLQPYPDALLDQITDRDADPAALTDRRESVALAFIAALQLLPATQRAVLILRDVLAFPARDVADLLETSVAGVNSALQRARTTLAHARADDMAIAPCPPGEREREVLEAFLQAWRACDIPALAALLRDDVVLSMPPQAIRIPGRDQVAGFFATVPADGRLDLIRLVVTRANGHPALAAYLPDESTQGCRGYGIMVLTLAGDRIATITGFPDPELFPLFGLPA
jgi:RNA polymerase sigma-70 factor (ECF subfamily)